MNISEEQTFVMLCSLFILHNIPNELIELEISLNNKETLSQSNRGLLLFLKAKQTSLYFTFQHCSFKKNVATNLDHDQ